MAADIRSLPREHTERFAPDPDVVRQLYELLQDAKSGKLRSVAYATVCHDGLSEWGLSGSGWVCSGSLDVYALNHAIGQLKRRWGRYCDETTT